MLAWLLFLTEDLAHGNLLMSKLMNACDFGNFGFEVSTGCLGRHVYKAWELQQRI